MSSESSPIIYTPPKSKNSNHNESPFNADITQYSIHDEGDSILLQNGMLFLKGTNNILLFYLFLFSKKDETQIPNISKSTKVPKSKAQESLFSLLTSNTNSFLSNKAASVASLPNQHFSLSVVKKIQYIFF